MILTSDLVNMPIGVAAGYAVMGFAIVFFGLILLMLVIWIMGRISASVQAKAAAAARPDSDAVEPAAAPAPAATPAPGSAGEVKLYGTNERDAAMIMAIVADKMQKPLNELRFISIREVK